MAKKLIYLASPYSNRNPFVRLSRFQAVCDAVAEMMHAGIMVYSPIAHTHSIAAHGGLPKGYEFWREFDERLIRACDELWVLKLEGWEKSHGTLEELTYARKCGKACAHIEPGNPTKPVYE